MNKATYLLIAFLGLTTLKAQNDCPPNPSAPTNQYCEEGQGISTDPNNLINVECPDLKNNFEWRVFNAIKLINTSELLEFIKPN